MAETGQAVFYSLPEDSHHKGQLRAAVVTLVKPAFSRKVKGGGTEAVPEFVNLTVFGDPSDGLPYVTGVHHVRDVLFDPDGEPGTFCTSPPAVGGMPQAKPDPPAGQSQPEEQPPA